MRFLRGVYDFITAACAATALLWAGYVVKFAVVAAFGALLAFVPAGCSATQATLARRSIAGADILVANFSRAAKPLALKCASDASALVKTSPKAAQEKLDGCRKIYDPLELALKLVGDAADASSAAVDTAEAIGSKDYVSALAPLLEAVRALVKFAVDAGLKIPPEAAKLLPGVLS